jgi:hypothetical protein
MARAQRAGQEFGTENFVRNSNAHHVVNKRMLSSKRAPLRLTLDPTSQMLGVRILCRASFVLIVVTATIANQADQQARAVGLLSFRVDAPSMWLGTHACMQPEAEDIPDEPEPEKPPCPKRGK